MSKLAKDQQDKSTEAGGVAQQALSAVRTVMYFNGQEQESKRSVRINLDGTNRFASQDYGRNS